MAFAVECERAEKDAGAGTLTEAQARKILNDILERTATGETLRCPSAGDYLREWVASKAATKTETTVAGYDHVVKAFLTHLGDRAAARPLTSLSTRQVQSFISARANAGLSASTVQTSAKVLRTILNRARRQGVVTTNVAEAVELPEGDVVERGTFTPAEIKMLVDAADGEWKTLILLGYFTGARLSDCCRMQWEMVDLGKGTLTFPQSRTDKPVIVPLHPELEAHLSKLASCDKPEKYLMPILASKGPGGRNGLSESFKNIMRKAGVDVQPVEREDGVRTLSRRSFHALRHSFASALANAGVAPELRMRLTGHASEAIHRGYSHLELQTLRDAIAKLPTL